MVRNPHGLQTQKGLLGPFFAHLSSFDFLFYVTQQELIVQWFRLPYCFLFAFLWMGYAHGEGLR